MTDLERIAAQAREIFPGLSAVRAAQVDDLVGVWVRLRKHSDQIFLEYDEGNWHVRHESSFAERCRQVHNLKELRM